MIYWFTGQPGSGKTVLANLLKEKFLPHAYRIDGDEMRDLFTNKDYSIKGRVTNIDTAQKISHYLHNQGKDVIVSLVSPYLDQREEFKTLLDWQIKEIYVHYNTSYVQRGRENYHVDNFGKPKKDFIDIDTTKQTEIESIINIATKLKL
jgi:adenylylsulfate kinase-like enzyme|tara:strand:+ start:4598 stop:5044 length:447 start_codon:yes stop_codon:yes gene_type:complete